MLRDEVKVYYYRDCFEYYDIPMDSYSYSSLIRTARSPVTIKNILRAAEKGKAVSPPLVRCAIESLGKLGDPLGAVAVASSMCEINDGSRSRSTVSSRNSDERHSESYYSRRMFDSSASGDSLLVALLENPQLLLVSTIETKEGDGNNFNDIETSSKTDSSPVEGFDICVGGGVGDSGLKEADIINLEKRLLGMQCGEAALHLLLTPSHSTSLSAIMNGARR